MNRSLMMQLTDSSLPMGGFAFSSGLEWMVKTKLLGSLEDFGQHLGVVLDQVFAFDLPYFSSLAADEAELDEIFQDYDSQMILPIQKKASLAQGAAWIKILPRVFPDSSGIVLQKRLETLGPPHYLLVFALGMLECTREASLEDVCWIHLYNIIRDQVSAAIRLGALGPMAATEFQSQALKAAERGMEENKAIWECPEKNAYLDAHKINPMLEIAQGDHQQLYTRLFQN